MRDANYINIMGWMVNRLDLRGNELILFAAIYGFSQDEESEYKGSLNYISDSIKVARRTASNVIDRLIEKHYIVKIEDPSGNRFKHHVDVVNHLIAGGAKSALVQIVQQSSAKNALIGSAKIAPNNTYTNNDNNVDTELDLQIGKTQKEKKQAKKTIFANSDANDISYVRKKLMENKKHIERYRGVDLEHYMEKVQTWNDKGGKKTTPRGWMAYIRQFMDGDIEKGKLVMANREKRKGEVVPTEAQRQGVHVNH